MNRVEFLQKYTRQYGSLYRAFVLCLTPEETCQVLDLAQERTKFDFVVRKIYEDTLEGFQECHRLLVSSLLETLKRSKQRKGARCASVLAALYPKTPKEIQKTIIEALLTSDYWVVRSRAYCALSENWRNDFLPLIVTTWNNFHDKETAEFIIEQSPPKFLAEHIDELAKDVSYSKHFSELFIRASEYDSGVLEKLKESNGITYAYVLHRKGEKLDNTSASDIYHRIKDETKIGFLLWCFGRMKLWENIMEVYEDVTRREKKSPINYEL